MKTEELLSGVTARCGVPFLRGIKRLYVPSVRRPEVSSQRSQCAQELAHIVQQHALREGIATHSSLTVDEVTGQQHKTLHHLLFKTGTCLPCALI